MSVTIIKEEESPLLHRKEIVIEADYDSVTPSQADGLKLIAGTKKVEGSLVVVKKILSKFGTKKAVITAYIYDSVDNLKKIEPKPKAKKEKKASTEEPAEAKSKEEPKKEQPKEAKAAAKEKPAEKKEENK